MQQHLEVLVNNRVLLKALPQVCKEDTGKFSSIGENDCNIYHESLTDCQEFIIGVSLSEPHSYVENSMVVHARRTVAKNGIATHYCIVWYGGSCTNKHNKLTDTSIQVLYVSIFMS